jgi:uncharacterized membrane protein
MKLTGLSLLVIGFLWIMAEITVGFTATSYTQSMWHQKNLSESETIPRSEAISALNSLTLHLKKQQSRIFLPAFFMLLGGIISTFAPSKKTQQSPS